MNRRAKVRSSIGFTSVSVYCSPGVAPVQPINRLAYVSGFASVSVYCSLGVAPAQPINRLAQVSGEID